MGTGDMLKMAQNTKEEHGIPSGQGCVPLLSHPLGSNRIEGKLVQATHKASPYLQKRSKNQKNQSDLELTEIHFSLIPKCWD